MPTNEARATATKGRLVAAARRLFAKNGYSATGTEAILAEAEVARGALYHHYRDKADLFQAVCRDLSKEAADAVDKATANIADPVEALKAGSLAWIAFMDQPDCRRILVLDAPGVLGRERWEKLDEELSFKLLRAGTQSAIEAKAVRFEAGAEALAVILNGAMNQIVIRDHKGDGKNVLTDALLELIERLRP